MQRSMQSDIAISRLRGYEKIRPHLVGSSDRNMLETNYIARVQGTAYHPDAMT
jgi:hypothetical protein